MANTFSARPQDLELDLSNGATDVFLDVLTLAGCAPAETPWEQHLVLHLGDAQQWGLGNAGFDLDDLPWTAGWPAEKAFLDRLIGLALTRHGWEQLPYDPPYALGYLTTFREMVAGYTPVPAAAPEWGDWRVPPEPALITRCEPHRLFAGHFGCRLCNQFA